MATAQAHAAAPISQLLVGGGAGRLRCWLPGRYSVEFIASLAGALATYLRELRFH